MFQVSRKGGKSQERMFFLFSDMMIYGKPKLLDSGNNSYSCCCVLPLRHCSVERVLGSVQRADGGGMFRVSNWTVTTPTVQVFLAYLSANVEIL